ncbi:MAG TPA: RimK family alpha-L-glutamate ligase [Clostridiales bacterium]|nr:RimK family alpha-L-glutamate ligase [Clostridiales bacterium]
MISKMPKGAVIVNAFWRGGDAGAEKLSAVLSLLGITAPVLKSTDLSLYVSEGVQGEIPFDFAVYLDKDDHFARLLEARGVRLFNSAESIRLADDKMLTHIALAPYVRQPKTISSPLFFAGEEDPAFLDRVEQELSYPIVVKKCFGAFGKQVYLAKDRNSLVSLRSQLIKEPHIYQQFIPCDSSDIRVITIGGKAVAAMKRKAASPDEFRANAELGGTGEAIALTPALRTVAESASRALGLEYAGVDLLWDEKGYLVTEVNSNAHYKLIEEVTGVPVASLYANYILSELTKGENA